MYRIKKEDTFRKDTRQSATLLQLKNNENLVSGDLVNKPLFSCDVELDIQIGMTCEHEKNKMAEKDALLNSLKNLHTGGHMTAVQKA